MDHLFRQQENTRVAVRPGLAQTRGRGQQHRLRLLPISGTILKATTVRRFLQNRCGQRLPPTAGLRASSTAAGCCLAFHSADE